MGYFKLWKLVRYPARLSGYFEQKPEMAESKS